MAFQQPITPTDAIIMVFFLRPDITNASYRFAFFANFIAVLQYLPSRVTTVNAEVAASHEAAGIADKEDAGTAVFIGLA